MPDLATLRLVLPELLLVATLVALLGAPLLIGRNTRVTALIALLGCVGAAIAAAITLGEVSAGAVELFGVPIGAGSTRIAGPGMLVADRLSMFFRLFVMVFLVAIIGMWFLTDAQRERNAPEFFTLLVASALGMSLMASTVNLVFMLVAIELASLPSYALAGFDRQRRLAAEASVKYVVFGATTAGVMCYGVSLLYGMFGTLHIPTLIARIAAADLSGGAAPLLAVALLCVFAGIAFKISAVPFHFWCPDVFQGASLPIATWLSVASKAAGLLLLLRLVFLAAGPTNAAYVDNVLPVISYGIGFFGILTCTVANLAAYGQSNVRRLLAYSSIAHAGYMLCAGAIVFRAGDTSLAAMSAVIAYLMVYMFMNLGAFMSLGLVASDTGSEEIDAFTGLGWRDPLTTFSFTVCLVSLVGLPPLGGFIAKFWLIWIIGGAAQSASAGLSGLLWVLVIAIAVNTAISLFYYTRVIRQMYLRGTAVTTGSLQAPALGKLAVHACALILFLAGTLLIPMLKRTADDAATNPYTVEARPVVTAEVARSED
ncbi:MAG: NADH-quinone oxidoreductase subunit N [Planctomycetes bacterium]|nr:NADH-quinone oxidoreductase subunit N [Planctomycetota bacterium]